MNTLLSTVQVGELVRNLMKKCRTFKPEETAGIDAVCQLYPEKAGGILVDALMELEVVKSPQGIWLSTTLASFCNRLGGVLGRKLQEAPEQTLPQLLDLAIMSGDSRLGTTVDQLLEHQSHDIRLKVIETLGSLKADKSVPRLAEVLLQKGWLKGKKLKTLQMATAQALVKIGTEQALEVLQKMAEEGSGELKSFCQKAVST
ncbi:MAG: HEAT repeat domain-containing protein [Deltaproteobacteria bacterium]|nr:HEAT repeat domain-containing protein [Deltaproteobacteria bacterium]